jgi:hypothetical protein
VAGAEAPFNDTEHHDETDRIATVYVIRIAVIRIAEPPL